MAERDLKEVRGKEGLEFVMENFGILEEHFDASVLTENKSWTSVLVH